MTTLLEVRNLVKHFGKVRAVDDVSFTIGAGETFAPEIKAEPCAKNGRYSWSARRNSCGAIVC